MGQVDILSVDVLNILVVGEGTVALPCKIACVFGKETVVINQLKVTYRRDKIKST